MLKIIYFVMEGGDLKTGMSNISQFRVDHS